TNTWSAVGNMSCPRSSHVAVLLGTGKVLIAGGFTSDGISITASAELFDPVANTFSYVGGMSYGRANPALETLSDGKILVAGGEFNSADAEIFDPALGTWQSAGWAGPWHGRLSLTRLASGEVLSLWDETARLLDPSAKTWTQLAPPAQPRRGQRAVRLQGDKVLILGGEIVQNNTSVNTNLSEVFDYQTKTFSPIASTFAMGVSSGLVREIPGGAVAFWLTSNTFSYYQQATDTWSIQALSGAPAAAEVLPNSTILVVEQAKTTAEIVTAGNSTCLPTTCAALGKNCGVVSDGCNGTLNCGSCASGQTCAQNTCTTTVDACSHSPCSSGAKLVASCNTCAQTVCGTDSYCCNSAWDSICVSEAKSMCGATCTPTCTPTTCAAQGKTCGSISNGCGSSIDCGTCPSGQTCSGNVCSTTGSFPCGHSLCASGNKVLATCSACATSVCKLDAYCCGTKWDSYCVKEAISACGPSCGE
ncbi:MAG TPA: kelch repeat-containing protein, partial [Polyangiaceae bacterium]